MRCKACDFCPTTGEGSLYNFGLHSEKTTRFITDPLTGDIYCETCYVPLTELFSLPEEDEEKEELDG